MTTSRTPLLRKKWPLLALVLAAILALILVIWQLQTSPETNDAYVYADTIDVVPEVSGRIVEMPIRDNQRVKKGDLLFRIDPRPYQAMLDDAKARLTTLDAQIMLTQRTIKAQEYNAQSVAAAVERARALGKETTSTRIRLEPLVPQGFASQEDLDQARTAEKAARAELEATLLQAKQASAAVTGVDAMVAMLLYLIGFGLSLAIGEVEVTGFQFDPLNLLGTFVFCLLVALTEEIMMRGYILGRLLHTRMNKFLALFVSALLFALLHIFNPNVAFLPMLNLVIAGMLIGASYLYTRNLCFPISLHLFWNWIQGPILGYQVSGNDLGTSLLTLHLPEENVLNGGAFGFEGSLICTVLMIIFTILIVWWGEKREAISLAVPRSC